MTRSDFYLRLLQTLTIRTSEQELVPLRLNVPQQRVWKIMAERLNSGKKIWLIILKARREGISTLIESLMVTWTATVDHTRSVITAHEKPATQIIQEIADRMIDYSPLRHGVRKLGTTRYFPFRSSQLSISTAGSPDAQRGNDITCFHGSEVASWPFPAALTATIQCIPTKHQSLCILESTAKGKTNEGQLFYDLWCEAYSDPEHSAWLPLFLPWYELPDYEWPNQQHPESWVYGPDWTPSMNGEVKVFEDLDDEEKELKARFTLRAGQLAWRRYEGMPKCKARKGSDLFFHQEYPSTPEEAFISSGIPFFLSRDLYWLQPTLCTGKRYRVYPDGRLEACDDGPVELWKLPEHGHEYVIGADSSMGIADDEHSRSAVEIVDMKTMEQVGEVDSQAAPHVLSSWLAGLGRAYNEALIAPEVNASGGGGGRSIIEYLIDRYEYFHLHRWRHPDAVRQDPGRLYGWETNVKTRPRMLAHIREVINEKCCLIHSRELARQLADFGQNAAGKYEATSGYDDLVFAWGIALCSRFENYHPWSPGVKKDPIQWDELGLGKVIQPWELEEARFQASCESVPAGTFVQNRGIWRPRREGPATPDEY